MTLGGEAPMRGLMVRGSLVPGRLRGVAASAGAQWPAVAGELCPTCGRRRPRGGQGAPGSENGGETQGPAFLGQSLSAAEDTLCPRHLPVNRLLGNSVTGRIPAHSDQRRWMLSARQLAGGRDANRLSCSGCSTRDLAGAPNNRSRVERETTTELVRHAKGLS